MDYIGDGAGDKLPSMMSKDMMDQKHLKPLSKYAQRVFSNPVAHTSIRHFIKPRNDLQNGTTKTKVTDCCQTASSKNPTCPHGLGSEFVGLFIGRGSLKKDPVACEGRRLVGSLIDNVDSRHCSKCETQSVALSFDLEVDDILSSSIPQRKCGQPSAAPPDDGGMCLNALSLDKDEGYSPYHTEDQTKPRNVSVFANQQPQASSRQLHLYCRNVKAQCFHIKGTESEQHSSVLDSKAMSAGPSTELARSPCRASNDNTWSEDSMESPLQVKVSRPPEDD